ncbi:MAG: Tex family protein [Deltaproteobacteria bacterium]
MDKEIILKNIITDLQLPAISVANTVALLEEGATVPFISRYRKERTGSLDEVQVRNVSEKLVYYTELEKRKETILKTIREQDKLTPDLEEQIIQCREKGKLEDLYLPYKPKKRTKATIAKEKGLEPLADLILLQMTSNGSKLDFAAKYIDPEKGVETAEQALEGARDIVAEKVAEEADVREKLRNYIWDNGKLCSKVMRDWVGKESKFQMYYDFSGLIKNLASHTILAIRRGAKEEVISWKVVIDETKGLDLLEGYVVRNRKSIFTDELCLALADSYKRLLFPSLEIEVFLRALELAETEAIRVFARNLRNLLLAPPAGNKMIMGIDPGFRTGCKVAVIDRNGNFKEYKAVFPHEKNRMEEAEKVLMGFIGKYKIELISIGNGTASKETSSFVNDIVKKNKVKATVYVASEAGASVYSASEVAIREFPDLDVTVRGAISIARRVQDPLAELVKIDPKSIGVGQYQHDVNQAGLKNSLDATVESCVNYVGVELNTASAELLSYVSGIGRTVAGNIVRCRAEKGSFKNKRELLQVPKLGEKTFEQCAGFLRIAQGDNPLDNSAIHPERYEVVGKIAADLSVDIRKLIGSGDLVARIDPGKYVTDSVGLPTLKDIMQELKKPGCDPRKEFATVTFSQEINKLEDLKVGMVLDGVVTNVANFGAFVDIGVHQDGLMHISKMSTRFVKDPHDIVSVGDIIKVKVLAVDLALKRISLEMAKA